MSANTEILFKLKIEDLCRKYALDLDKYSELAIHLRGTAKTDREREYWFQMLVKLDKASNDLLRTADEFREFRVQSKSKQLPTASSIDTPRTEKGSSTEVAISAAPLPVPAKVAHKPWLISQIEKPLNLAAKLITWNKRP